MKNKLKNGCLCISLMLSYQLGFTNQIIKPIGSKIYGYPPYYLSIGSNIIETGIVKNGIKKISVGALIEVPSYLYKIDNTVFNSFYKLIDRDNDIGSAKGISRYNLGLDNNYPGTINKETNIRWFIIEANEGYRFADEDPEQGKLITSWTPEQIKIIKEITEPNVGYYGQSINSKAMIVPEDAVGHRIGFWALPETENGTPSNGYWIKVYDLNYFFTQLIDNEPSSTEIVDPDEDCNKGYCGSPILTVDSNNPGGGGGDVPPIDECLFPLVLSHSTEQINRVNQKNTGSDSIGRILDLKIEGPKRVGRILTVYYKYQSFVITDIRTAINNTVYTFGPEGTTAVDINVTDDFAGENRKQGWNSFEIGPLPEDSNYKIMEIRLRPYNGIYEYESDVTISFLVLPPLPLPCINSE